MKQIQLDVDEPAGVDRTSQPVTQGVPFAEGDLERGAPVRLVDEAGAALPLQTACLTTWRSDLRHVKWLLLASRSTSTPAAGADCICNTDPGSSRDRSRNPLYCVIPEVTS